MNSPGVMTRFIGTPVVAAVLYVAGVFTTLGWMNGAVPWWVGLIALASIVRVAKATRQVKAYKAWLADWQAMGGYSAPAGGKPAKKPASRGRLAAQALAFFLTACIILNMTTPGQKTPDAVALLWFLMVGGFIWRAGKLIAAVQRDRRNTKTKDTGAKDKMPAADVVEWSLPPASFSPSRSDATCRLPEYAARLIEPAPGITPGQTNAV